MGFAALWSKLTGSRRNKAVRQEPSNIHRPFSFESRNQDEVPELPAMPLLQPEQLSEQVLDSRASRRSRWISSSDFKADPSTSKPRSTTTALPSIDHVGSVSRSDANVPPSETIDEKKKRRKTRGLSFFKDRREHTAPGVPSAPRLLAVDSNRSDSPEQPREARRISRGLSLSRMKSNDTLGKRRSLFGGNANNYDEIPVLPLVNRLHWLTDMSNEDPAGSETSSTSDVAPAPDVLRDREQVVRTKSLSATRSTSKRRPQSSGSSISTAKRKSWFFNNNPALGSDAPPMPPVPALIPLSTLVSSAALPPTVAMRRTRRLSLGAIITGNELESPAVATNEQKRKTWNINSSADSDVLLSPPVPALVYDGLRTPESMATTRVGSTSPLDPIESPVVERIVVRGGSLKQPRPVSIHNRASYRPKSVAGGFVRATNSPIGPDRRSYHRRTIMNDGEDGMICLNDEQQVEWENLKNLMEAMERRKDNGVFEMVSEIDTEDDELHDAKFSNAQALAALEFGVAR